MRMESNSLTLFTFTYQFCQIWQRQLLAAMQDEQQIAELMNLFSRHQRRLLAYIQTLVPSRNDVEDIMQEVGLVMLKKFNEFEPGSNFIAWAYRIAYHEVQHYYQRRRNKNLPCIDVEALQCLSKEVVDNVSRQDARHEALLDCLKRLSERDRQLVMTRYEAGGGVVQAAQLSGRSIQAAYKALSRIRNALMQCVDQKLANPIVSNA
jgi:RNA polymerase sigma-70 factor, ECF subfamily